jgi:PIN domain nuclease of toxin-antitoxin system
VNILLDTCVFLWYALEPEKLTQTAQLYIRDVDNTVYFSVVSAWEISLKYSVGRLPLPAPPGQFVPRQIQTYGFRALKLNFKSALHSAMLPRIHNDPFDRVLISQCIKHCLSIVTPDHEIRKYPGITVIW